MRKGVLETMNTAEKILKKKVVAQAGGFTDHIQLNELPYCKPVKKWLIDRYGKEANQIWKETARNYNKYLSEIPDYGGKKNGHARAIYGGLLIFALYPALPDQPPITELQDFVQNMFMGPFTTLGKVFNLNRSFDMWLIDKVFRKTGNRDRKDIKRYPDGFINIDEPYDRKHHAARYSFTQCPNAEFAREHDLLHVLPLLCNSDFFGIHEIHGRLIRCGTCGNSAKCDYLIVGTRNLTEKNMPRQNTFANRFSNFWFRLQTGIDLQDTQSGYRLYTLSQLRGLSLITSRYEAELELLVYAAWAGTQIISVPVKVYYPPAEERVSHFRPVYDFVRISILNTFLCIAALFVWLKQWAYTIFSFVYFLGFAVDMTIRGFFLITLGGGTKDHKLKYHTILQRKSRFVINHVPGTTFSYSNPHGETFEKPATGFGIIPFMVL